MGGEGGSDERWMPYMKFSGSFRFEMGVRRKLCGQGRERGNWVDRDELARGGGHSRNSQGQVRGEREEKYLRRGERPF